MNVCELAFAGSESDEVEGGARRQGEVGGGGRRWEEVGRDEEVGGSGNRLRESGRTREAVGYGHQILHYARVPMGSVVFSLLALHFEQRRGSGNSLSPEEIH